MADTQTTKPPAGSLKDHLGEVFDEVFAQGHRAGRDEGYKAGLTEGARIERERVRGLIAQALEDPAAAERPEDGVTSKAGAAQVIPEIEKAKAAGLSMIRKVLAAAGMDKAVGRPFTGQGDKEHQPLPAAVEHEGMQAAGPGPSLEERCKAEWERESRLRDEFGTLEAYTAFTRQREAGLLG